MIAVPPQTTDCYFEPCTNPPNSSSPSGVQQADIWRLCSSIDTSTEPIEGDLLLPTDVLTNRPDEFPDAALFVESTSQCYRYAGTVDQEPTDTADATEYMENCSDGGCGGGTGRGNGAL